jgi:4-amino-4-deoxy-L-arabinose transferase-like glycosyltransferase
MISFIKKYSEVFVVIGLAIIFYLLFFYNIGNYELMDVDETRYVAIARDMFHSKDFLTLYLNGEFFFEKPPLYFWNECLSFFIFGGVINEFTARFPVALLGFLFSFMVYFTSKHWVDRKFGIFTSLVIATSLEFIILAKYAILDIVLTFYISLALVCYFATYFCKENHTKIYWWMFYIFIGLGVMSKGIPALAIPFGGAFICSLLTKNLKKLFNPKYFLTGIVLFSIIVLPWHIIMLKLHGGIFFFEYIVKHHLQRFINSAEIGRKQPFYYYFIILLWGFIPWILSMISVFIERFKNIKTNKFYEKYICFNDLDNTHKLIYMSWIFVFWIMLFFSTSSTKLATYILPIYYPLAIITGLVWKDYTEGQKHINSINISVIIAGILSIIFAIASIFSNLFLPEDISRYFNDIKLFIIILFSVFGILSIIFIKYKKYLWTFILYVSLMIILSMFGTKKLFELDYKFGQKELMEFAKYAQKQDKTLSANGMNRKYSLLYYNDEIVDYNKQKMDINAIKEDLMRKNNFVILEKDNFKKIKNYLNYRVIKNGKRYIMIEGL